MDTGTQLETRVDAVIDLHGPVQEDLDETAVCSVCVEPYPCETVNILTNPGQ